MFNTATTTYQGGKPAEKPFTWSFSRLKNYNTCPKRYFHYDVAKDVPPEEKSEALVYGDEVHAAMAKRVSRGTPLPPAIESFEKHVTKLLDGSLHNPKVKILTERKYAIRKNLTPCGYFDKDVWYRAVADALRVQDNVALLVDWKTGGKPNDVRKVAEIIPQLWLATAAVFAHHPEVQGVGAKFVWLDHDAETKLKIMREQMPAFWEHIAPNLQALEQAHKENNFPPKPSGLCREFCGVTSCEFYGIGR
jgi:uncharacterized protein Usg